ncbi:MAG: hypothetical protein OXI05_10900 [Bacteroidota bacterium]|nr:hypothetical protein [Bacteroidota bacterium]MDE2646327.1 hypothetical protein [Bacteroidota bacterium]MXW15299.1 hypothetical protein [Rhodothermaceae bacterium]MYC05317.1 hypothetical protein [Rhodothermaceae bacterium]MYI18338.1 hypothetical protein [Rhodothermaceae bacterium]
MAVSIRGSFQRSINLVRDFYSTRDVDSYIVTSKACELIKRVIETITAKQVIGCAWSITGPYGSGKSSFALFLAHLLRGNADALNKLTDADPALTNRLESANPGIYCPVLVVGSREPLSLALLNGLIHGVDSFRASFARHRGKPSKKVAACRSELGNIFEEAKAVTSSDVSDDIVVDLYQRTAAAVHAATNGGLLLIVDELGKLLEYAALYPDRSDLYILQCLAERASRIGDSSDVASPLLIFSISHQAFDRYAGRMTRTQRDEWRKVQGRFEDFAFVEPVSETLRLLAHAVQVDNQDQLPKDGMSVIDNLLNAAYLGSRDYRAQIRKYLADALPLHPAVSLIVGPLFRRLAQNKRSLFAFLASGEPNSFLYTFANQASETSTHSLSEGHRILQSRYRLDHLYDYIVGAVGSALFSERMGKFWAETEAVLLRLKSPSELAVRCIKQVALLGYAGPLAGLPPTTKLLCASADESTEKVKATLDFLREERLVTYRPFKDEYHIWQGSEFDLDAALQEARLQLPARTPLATLLTDILPPTPMVARRHSFRTGTTRIFEVIYASDETWISNLQNQHWSGDGRIIYVLPEHDGEINTLLSTIQELADDSLTLLAVPHGMTALREIVRELACLQWVRKNADELQGDDVARQEIDQQIADLTIYVEHCLTSLLTDDEGRNPCSWIYRGEQFRLQNERFLQDKLSQICDQVFSDTPEVWNELLNRRKPSASAVKGLKQLLVAMLENDTEYRLNIEKYPAEYGMYASILLSTGIHRPADDDFGHWHFARPISPEYPGCIAVWDEIADALKAARGQRVSVQMLYGRLCIPPYGVREGLIPVFLLAVYKSAQDEIAFYENGTFVPNIDFQTIERFLKNPEKFELQWVEIKGSRAELLQYLAPLVGLPASVEKPLPFVLRILKRIHGLPPYVRRTVDLSKTALNVREALDRAKEPTTLLFEDLPEACGVNSFLENSESSLDEVQSFVERLQEALRELGGAYDVLLTDLQNQIASVFHLHSKTPNDRRQELANRARFLLPYASETKLKAFLVRASDEVLDTQGWYESLSSLLASRPPVQWRDEDHLLFSNSLREVSRGFSTLEPIIFDLQEEPSEDSVHDTNSPTVKRVRLSVTMQYEDEHEQVVSIHPEDRKLIEQLCQRLQSEIAKEDVTLETKIAAVAQLSNQLLIQRKAIRKSHE